MTIKKFSKLLAIVFVIICTSPVAGAQSLEGFVYKTADALKKTFSNVCKNISPFSFNKAYNKGVTEQDRAFNAEREACRNFRKILVNQLQKGRTWQQNLDMLCRSELITISAALVLASLTFILLNIMLVGVLFITTIALILFIIFVALLLDLIFSEIVSDAGTSLSFICAVVCVVGAIAAYIIFALFFPYVHYPFVCIYAHKVMQKRGDLCINEKLSKRVLFSVLSNVKKGEIVLPFCIKPIIDSLPLIISKKKAHVLVECLLKMCDIHAHAVMQGSPS